MVLNKLIWIEASKPFVNELFTIGESTYFENTKALAAAAVIIVVALLLVLTCITSINIELSLQQEMELFAFKHALGDHPGNGHDKKMIILPCDTQHECQTSI